MGVGQYSRRNTQLGLPTTKGCSGPVLVCFLPNPTQPAQVLPYDCHKCIVGGTEQAEDIQNGNEYTYY